MSKLISIIYAELNNERAKRARYHDLLKRTPVRVKRNLEDAKPLIESFKTEVYLMIPEISPPPTTVTS